ncbi:MAG: hypothetical protein WC511_01650 [Candidatus Pacearchaeota archaeon]
MEKTLLELIAEYGETKNAAVLGEITRRVNEIVFNCPSCGRHDFGLYNMQNRQAVMEENARLKAEVEKLTISEKEAKDGWMSEYYAREAIEAKYSALISEEVAVEGNLAEILKGFEGYSLDTSSNVQIPYYRWYMLKKYIQTLQTIAKEKMSWDIEDLPMPEDEEIKEVCLLNKHENNFFFNSALDYTKHKNSKAAITDLILWLLVVMAEKKQIFDEKEQWWIDIGVHYRNLSILLGAKPNQMMDAYDKRLCESGLGNDPEDPNNKNISEYYVCAHEWNDKFVEFLEQLKKDFFNICEITSKIDALLKQFNS